MKEIDQHMIWMSAYFSAYAIVLVRHPFEEPKYIDELAVSHADQVVARIDSRLKKMEADAMKRRGR